MVEIEQIIMELVVNGGNGRSKALQAIQAARENHIEEAEKLLKESNEEIAKAHHFQTELIQNSMNEEQPTEVSLLVVHSQDHLMDAMVVRDLAVEMVEMYRIFYSQKK